MYIIFLDVQPLNPCWGDCLKEPGNNPMAIAWQHLANNHYQNEYLGRYLYIKGNKFLSETNVC
ncbi:MAG: hypothetical protein BGO55_19745 [Sphingobacteriales bacterium 50-39]|nr:MAG: hypothetical protein BGO55_19745 [Sphingobacteriales bacterium 50-39]